MRSAVLPLSLLLFAACDGSGDADPPIAFSKGGPPPCTSDCPAPSKPPSVDVENRTGAPIEIRVSSAQGLRIDRRIMEGSFALPIPPKAVGSETRFTAAPQQITSFDAHVTVVEGASERLTIGGVVRVGEGPRFLAIGAGRLFVRLGEDGLPFFEAEDPKTLTLVPADTVLAECAPGVGTFDEPFDAPQYALYDAQIGAPGASLRVLAVTRDASGCREIAIGNDLDAPITRMRACLPDGAYPFADGDEISLTAGGDSNLTSTLWFENVRGDVLVLGRVAFRQGLALDPRISTELEGVELAYGEDTSCGRIETACGHVDVPAKMKARTNDDVIHSVVYGQPIEVPSEGRTFFVLGASARPVAATRCSTADPDSTKAILARAWVAIVKRGQP